MKIKDVRGLSPVIATVLLITITIVIALIVFLWIRGMTQEAVTKFGGKNIQLVCDEISFEASYSEDTLYISNPGNVPIFGMNVKIIGDGSYSTEDLREESNSWPETGLNQGGVFSDILIFNGNQIVLIPVLIGESNSGRKTYVCDENQYGYSIII
ncbi:MAG: archaellin/type IV pilin N-terminal domain-containing protein [Candidatus Diapherotrites archaeon]